MKKIWDTQNNRPLFVIDESALHNRVRSKRNKAERTANITEWLLILTNIASAILWANVEFSSDQQNVFIYLVATWFVATSIFVIIVRWRRISSTKQFDRTMLGDLENAITNASFQVRISKLMRWNVIPVAAFILLALLSRGTAFWVSALIVVLFAVAFFASGWEHRIYENRKRELDMLRRKLIASGEGGLS